MRTSYLDFYKLVLQKVSFDNQLLLKEYQKASRDLSDVENQDLLEWLQEIGLIQYISSERECPDT